MISTFAKPPKITEKRAYDNLLYHTTTVLVYDVAYPNIYLENQNVEKRLNTYYKDTTSRYLMHIKNGLYPQAVAQYKSFTASGYPFNAYSANKNFLTEYNKNSFLSTYSDTYEYTGGAHGVTTRSSVTFDYSNGKKMKLGDFFIKGEDYKDIILTSMTDSIKKQIESGESYYFDNWHQVLLSGFSENQFYLSELGFTFYYQPYTLAAGAAGVVTFPVPYTLFGEGLKYNLEK